MPTAASPTAPLTSLAPGRTSRGTLWALVAACIAIPLALVWDYSWESTIGVDLLWSPPHVALDLAVALACLAAAFDRRRSSGSWLVLWGALAFLAAAIFERWWQASYGLAAGIWGPPQLLNTAAVIAVQVGALLTCAISRERIATSMAGASLLLMISMISLATLYPNRQHSAAFFQSACATYPLVLAALSTAQKDRWSATLAALGYTALWGAMVWILPLFPGSPQIAPIFNPRDHMLPPPFPLLLVLPALVMDFLLRPSPVRRPVWREALEGSIEFFLLFVATQWTFSAWLLTPAAANRFFAGGGEHWPYFLQIAPDARTTFWSTASDTLNARSGLIAFALAFASTFAGLHFGRWLKAVRR